MKGITLENIFLTLETTTELKKIFQHAVKEYHRYQRNGYNYTATIEGLITILRAIKLAERKKNGIGE